MRLDRLFFLYMAGVGAALGALLVVKPAAGDFVIKPYFWMVIAVVAFDLVCYLRGRGVPGSMLAMEGRLIGFMIGIIALVAVPWLAGSPAKFF
jgi:hypothetical protein